MGKLEELVDRREAADKANMRAALKVNRAAEEKRRRQTRLDERREFNRLFKKLLSLVKGHWDRNGWGWTFQYKDKDYWISHDSWSSPKTPGDADDYDMSGHHWVLKNNFNAMLGSDCCGKAIVLGEGVPVVGDKTELTENVLEALRKMSKR